MSLYEATWGKTEMPEDLVWYSGWHEYPPASTKWV